MSDPQPPTFQTESAGYLANHMARLFAHHLAAEIGPLGLAPAQFMVLLELWAGDGLTQSALVQKADVEQATMASTLKRMERDGLIQRSPHLEDSRSQVVRLTAKARAMEAEAMAAARRVNMRALADLDADEARALLGLMRRVVKNLRSGRAKARGGRGETHP